MTKESEESSDERAAEEEADAIYAAGAAAEADADAANTAAEEEATENDADSIIKKILLYKPSVSVTGATVQQISNESGMPRSTVAWHLNYMKGAGTVKSQTVGRAEVYYLSNTATTSTTGGEVYGCNLSGRTSPTSTTNIRRRKQR